MADEQKDSNLIKIVHDQELIDFFYLNYSLEELIEKIHSLRFTFLNDTSLVPFNAQLRGYISMKDNKRNIWIAKELAGKPDVYNNRLFELTYYIDFELQTLAAPLTIIKKNKKYFRATKVLNKATQISGYDYLEEPLRRVLANDLINRWLTFDEDRNPNNYMVIHNSKGTPLIVAIDFNHTDLESTKMKITGRKDQFGWHRTEKTRFLTLLKPANFEGYTIKNFKKRLNLMMDFSAPRIKNICLKLFKTVCKNYEAKAELITSNIIKRKNYINNYFRKWFAENKKEKANHEKSDYSGLGKCFVDYYKKKI